MRSSGSTSSTSRPSSTLPGRAAGPGASSGHLPDEAGPVPPDRPLRAGRSVRHCAEARRPGPRPRPGERRPPALLRGPGPVRWAQRDLAPGVSHRLEASYPLALADVDGRFFADVNDIEGRGNEAVFPTLNAPHELARHVLVFRVHAAEPYLAVGSGLLAGRAAGDIQEWMLDTEREVASYTVMFHLAPGRPTPSPSGAFAGWTFSCPRAGRRRHCRGGLHDPDLWLAELQGALGPFPTPRGLAVVLTQAGGGMEYYGATTTSLRALRHEVFHMYFACSTVARTYRDSWWDEAIDMWYELSADPAYAPIEPGYRSDIVSGRSAVAVGFDRRAYDQGSRIMQAVATGMGGRERMVRFLRDLCLRFHHLGPGRRDPGQRRRRPRAVPAVALRLPRQPGQRPRHLGLGLAAPGGHGAAGRGECPTAVGGPPPRPESGPPPRLCEDHGRRMCAQALRAAQEMQTENGFHV